MRCNILHVGLLGGAVILAGNFNAEAAPMRAMPVGGYRGAPAPAYRPTPSYRSVMPQAQTIRPTPYNYRAATIARPAPQPVVPPVVNPGINRINPNHPPGWDWWRTYPWSWYNAWRNPYWYPPYNGLYPYPPYQAYPYPIAVPYSYGISVDPAPYYGADNAAQPVQAAKDTTPLPRPTGALQVPPSDGAIIQIRGLDQFTPVRFNGQEVTSMGNPRYYVTSDFAPGRKYTYTIVATVNRNGQPTTEERQIEVMAGSNMIVDLGRPLVASR